MKQIATAQEYFDTLAERFVPAAARGVHATFQYELSGDDGGTWHVTVNDGSFTTHTGPAPAPSTTLKMKSSDYVNLVNGRISGAMAFMKGQMKVSGNILFARKMEAIFPPAK